MATSKRKRRASAERSGAHASGGASPLGTMLCGALIATGVALVTALVLALIFAAVGVRGEDPAAKAPFFGLVTLALSSVAAGAACARLTHASPLVCAALGAAITAALMLVSLIPALPQVCLPIPKAICAAIPVVCVLAGAVVASPRQGKRRRKH